MPDQLLLSFKLMILSTLELWRIPSNDHVTTDNINKKQSKTYIFLNFLLRFLNYKFNKNTPDSKRELDERPCFIDLSVENKQISITTAEVMNKVSLIIGTAALLTPSGCKGC